MKTTVEKIDRVIHGLSYKHATHGLLTVIETVALDANHPDVYTYIASELRRIADNLEIKAHLTTEP